MGYLTEDKSKFGISTEGCTYYWPEEHPIRTLNVTEHTGPTLPEHLGGLEFREESILNVLDGVLRECYEVNSMFIEWKKQLCKMDKIQFDVCELHIALVFLEPFENAVNNVEVFFCCIAG